MPVRIDIAALTPRTATLRLLADGARYMLPAPVVWDLQAAEGTIRSGTAERVVVTLAGLDPDTDYLLRAGDSRCRFRTPPCRGRVDITEFGAAPGRPDNGAEFTAAVAAVPRGGTLHVPAGTWVTSPVFLKSHMTLHLDDGAELRAPASRATWPILPAHHPDGRMLGTWEGVPEAMYAALVNAIDCRDLAITGPGILNGGGADGDWWTWPKETRDGARRARTLFLSTCETVVLSGFTVRNSPSWTVHPVYCRGLTAADLHIDNPPDSPNTDGFDPESCEDVVIEGVHFSVGDDCIAIKAGRRTAATGHLRPTRNVAVRHCRMERGHGGVVIGSEMSGSVSDVAVEDSDLVGTDRGLRIKTRRGRGGSVERIRMRRCRMSGVHTGFVVNAFYFCDADGTSDAVQSRAVAPVDETTPRVRDIEIADVILDDVRIAVGAFLGLPEAPIEGVVLRDIRVTYDAAAVADVPVMACGVPAMRHAGIIAEYAGVTIGGTLHPEYLASIQGVTASC